MFYEFELSNVILFNNRLLQIQRHLKLKTILKKIQICIIYKLHSSEDLLSENQKLKLEIKKLNSIRFFNLIRVIEERNNLNFTRNQLTISVISQ